MSTLSADFSLGEFVAERGGRIPEARLRYRIFGDPELIRRQGASLVFHALTGNADVDDWWGPLVGPGRALDTDRHPVVAANLLGGCSGSTGPTGNGTEPFPGLTPADLARAHIPLLRHLGAERLGIVAGGSLGGMVALHWGRLSPVPIERLVVLAAPARTTAQTIAWNAAQRMAIEADPAWAGGRYSGEGPAAGLAAARAIAMITYRSQMEMEARFGRRRARDPERFDVDGYLRRQGEKLVARFDARSYRTLMDAMDHHDLGDLATAARETASRVGEIIGVGIDTDILYPASLVREWVGGYRAAGAPASYREVNSIFGHDAFLLEFEQVGKALRGDGVS